MSKTVKVAVTGAAGQIGYAIAFRIASGQMFGSDVKVQLSLLELEVAMKSLEGVVMELEDCAFPLVDKIEISSDLDKAFSKCNWAVLVGAVPRKAGMERNDLLSINGGIFTKQGQAIEKNAASDVRILVVGNPCNTNALIAMNNAKSIPSNRWYAMTRLDENRAKSQLAIKAGQPVSSVKDMIIWGNHSATQFPDFENAKINGKKLTDVITDRAWLEGDFMKTVQQRGAAIIAARGMSSAASAANAAIDTVHALTHPGSEIHSVAVCSDGSYGVDKGLMFGYPIRTKSETEVEIVQGYELSAYGKGKFETTLKELREEKAAVESLKLI